MLVIECRKGFRLNKERRQKWSDSYDYRRVLLRTPRFVFNSFKLSHSLGLTQIQTMKDRWPRCRTNSGGAATSETVRTQSASSKFCSRKPKKTGEPQKNIKSRETTAALSDCEKKTNSPMSAIDFGRLVPFRDCYDTPGIIDAEAS